MILRVFSFSLVVILNMTYAGVSMIESHHTFKAGSKEQKDLDYILYLPDDIDIKMSLKVVS